MSMKSLIAAAAAAVAVALSAGAANAQTFGSMNVTTGFTPDPVFVEIPAGGSVNSSQLSNGVCNAGFVAEAPDYAVNFSAGSTLPLWISAWSSVDTTLFIQAPNGQVFCDDDGGDIGLSPSIGLSNPVSGTYRIWIGVYEQGNTGTKALLSISELKHF